MRRAPREGYDFSRKRDYRRKVWATFRDTLKRWKLSVSLSHALLMPSLEGDEIDVALNAGFMEENLHVVDQEPAIVATLKKRYPKITTYGVTVSRAFERLSSSGIKIRCANLDFCSQLSTPLAGELAKVALLGSVPCRISPLGSDGFSFDMDSQRYVSGVFNEQCVIAVSVLRGRESRKTTEAWNTELCDTDALSVAAINTEEEIRRLITESPVGIDDDERQRLTYVYRRFLQLSAHDRHRVATTWFMLGLKTSGLAKVGVPADWHPLVQLLRTESYLSSSGQTMLWSIFSVHSAIGMMRTRNAANAKRVSIGIAPVMAWPIP